MFALQGSYLRRLMLIERELVLQSNDGQGTLPKQMIRNNPRSNAG